MGLNVTPGRGPIHVHTEVSHPRSSPGRFVDWNASWRTEPQSPRQIHFTLGPDSSISQAQRIHTSTYDPRQVHTEDGYCLPPHVCPTARVVSYTPDPSGNERNMSYSAIPGMPGVAIASNARQTSFWFYESDARRGMRTGWMSYVLGPEWELQITARERPYDPSRITHHISGDEQVTIFPNGIDPISVKAGYPAARELQPSRVCEACHCSCFDEDDSEDAWSLKPGSTLQVEVEGGEHHLVKAVEDPAMTFRAQRVLPSSRHSGQALLEY